MTRNFASKVITTLGQVRVIPSEKGFVGFFPRKLTTTGIVSLQVSNDGPVLVIGHRLSKVQFVVYGLDVLMRFHAVIPPD